MARLRLKNFCRLFYSSANGQQPYVAYHNEYLYRQGDSINGIFCILDGEVRRIKETYQEKKSSGKGSEAFDRKNESQAAYEQRTNEQKKRN